MLSAAPSAEIEIPTTDIPSFFFQSVRRHAAFTDADNPRPLLIDGTEGISASLTIDSLEQLCQQLASGLYHEMGVRRGDVVAIAMPSSIHYPAVALAALMVGAKCTLANPAYTARELRHQLEDSGAAHVITTSAQCPTVCEAVASGSGPVRKLLVVDEDAPSCSLPTRTLHSILGSREFPRARIDNDKDMCGTVAFIPYSSGTTGPPKGVMLSHRNIVACVLQSATLTAPQSFPSTNIGVLPMFHVFGLLYLCFLMPYNGTTTVVMPQFSMPRFLKLVADYRATETMLVPPIINGLVKMPSFEHDLSSLRRIVVGAAALSAETIVALERRLPGLCITQGYGMTEASPTITLNPPGMRNATSVGTLAPGIQAKVVDTESGQPLAPGETGELCFRGPNIMMGYLNNAAATRDIIDADGFLHTGDIGRIDEHNYVILTDRKKELIKFNGFQVAPAELEGLLMQHPQVTDCAVAGIYCDERQTEVPKAYLVLSADVPAAEHARVGKEIVGWLNKQVAYFKQLRGGFAILDRIPKNASGKILRRLLRK
ncbi:hypothetical protein GGF46_004089 [Coemansia sp. RSA 552]|nr:hypothetical protein GGF46_004089 [Coemansia sp. RSA 552]